MSKPVKAAVFGTGSWGTAFGMVLADAGCDTVLWGRRPELADAVNSTRTNPDYLPGVELPENLRATTDPAEAAMRSTSPSSPSPPRRCAPTSPTGPGCWPPTPSSSR